MNFSMFHFKLKMKSLVVLVFAVVALSVMECSVAGTKFGFFFLLIYICLHLKEPITIYPGGGRGGVV